MGNLHGIAGEDGITIWSSDVTLDANEFALGGGDPGDAIYLVLRTPRITNVTIRNGTIQDWG